VAGGGQPIGDRRLQRKTGVVRGKGDAHEITVATTRIW
jgi:hypothetical protein